MIFTRDTLAEIAPWIAEHGYLIVFACLALETVLFASMVVPGLLVLIAAGFFAGLGRLDPFLLVGVGVPAVWLGDLVSYGLGRVFWSRLLTGRRFGRAMDQVRPVLETRGTAFLVLYHFEPITRMVGAAAAGSMGLPLRRWMPLAFLGGGLWVIVYSTIGYYLARLGRDLGDWERFRPLSAIFTLLLLIWLWIVSRAVKRSLSVSPEVTGP